MELLTRIGIGVLAIGALFVVVSKLQPDLGVPVPDLPTQPRTVTHYQWTDANGNVKLTSNLDEVPLAARETMGQFEVPVAAPARSPRGGPAVAAVSSPPVIIYTTQSCGYCKRAIRDLKQARVDYLEKDIQRDPQAREELLELTGRTSVPVLDIDGFILHGYDEELLAKRLSKLN